MDRRTVSWIDVGDNERQTFLSSSGGCPGTFAAIVAISNAAWTNWFEGVFLPTVAPGPALTEYISVGDMVALNLGTATFQQNRIFLPAPLRSIFLADLQTVDLTDLLVMGIANATAAELLNPITNDAVTVLRDSWLTRRSGSIREAFIIGGSSASYAQTLVWIDAQGRTTSIRLSSDNGAPMTMAALEAASNAVILGYWGGDVTVNGSPALSSSAYASVLDSANILALDATGAQTTIVIPAPDRSIFYADGETIDLTNTLVAGLVAAIHAELVIPSSGNAIAEVVGGTLHRRNISGAR